MPRVDTTFGKARHRETSEKGFNKFNHMGKKLSALNINPNLKNLENTFLKLHNFIILLKLLKKYMTNGESKAMTFIISIGALFYLVV